MSGGEEFVEGGIWVHYGGATIGGYKYFVICLR